MASGWQGSTEQPRTPAAAQGLLLPCGLLGAEIVLSLQVAGWPQSLVKQRGFDPTRDTQSHGVLCFHHRPT